MHDMMKYPLLTEEGAVKQSRLMNGGLEELR